VGPDIAPNSTLIFEVELLSVKSSESAAIPARSASPISAEDVDSYVRQAEALIRTGDVAQAVATYEKALAINPADSSLHTKLGMLCLNYYLQNRGIGGSMDFLYKARDAFNKAIRLNSSNPDAYLGRGIVFDQLVNPEQALADLTKAIELDPKNAEAFKRRADVFYRMNRNEQAISDYTKALAIRPDYPDALAARQRAQKEVEKAKADQDAWNGGGSPKGFEAKVEASRQKAYEMYPDVRYDSTELGRRVNAAAEQMPQSNPEFLHDPDWPFKITKAVVEQIKKEESDARSAKLAQIEQQIRNIDIAIESDAHAQDVIRSLGGVHGQPYLDLESKIRELEARRGELVKERDDLRHGR
jgi:tetratricopeptide (TPR) repeat protein